MTIAENNHSKTNNLLQELAQGINEKKINCRPYLYGENIIELQLQFNQDILNKIKSEDYFLKAKIWNLSQDEIRVAKEKETKENYVFDKRESPYQTRLQLFVSLDRDEIIIGIIDFIWSIENESEIEAGSVTIIKNENAIMNEVFPLFQWFGNVPYTQHLINDIMFSSNEV